MKLTFDYGALQQDRGYKPSYHDATLSYMNGGEMEEMPVRIRVRGAYRRDPATCNFPPIHMKFDKDEIPKGSVFKGQKKMKVVTHCQLESEILKEYYVYKMYNLFTDLSFNVRLAKITYIDTKGAQTKATKYAFFIESTKHMAERNGGKELNEMIPLLPEDVDREKMTMVTMFQYMVANKDFAVNKSTRKNLKIITNKNLGGKPIPIPYDYDWSGIINASYLNRGSSFKKPLSAMAYYLKQREVFNPNKICRSTEEYQAVIAKFQELQPTIFEMYKTSPHLDKTSIKETLKAYKNFYKFIKNPKNVETTFVGSCPNEV
ncbi:MAG: hypothetical protein AAFR87_02820 [Bacteroidota bacterium]